MPRPWTINDRLRLYHGTDDHSANLLAGGGAGISLARCQPLTDFGRGFYTTTQLHQARNWANTRALRLFRQGQHLRAAIIRFDLAWGSIRPLTSVSFVVEGALTSQYWDLVQTCRTGQLAATPPYDVVFGPVSLWPQTLTIRDCDQISFHSNQALRALGSPQVEAVASGANLLFVVT